MQSYIVNLLSAKFISYIPSSRVHRKIGKKNRNFILFIMCIRGHWNIASYTILLFFKVTKESPLFEG